MFPTSLGHPPGCSSVWLSHVGAYLLRDTDETRGQPATTCPGIASLADGDVATNKSRRQLRCPRFTFVTERDGTLTPQVQSAGPRGRETDAGRCRPRPRAPDAPDAQRREAGRMGGLPALPAALPGSRGWEHPPAERLGAGGPGGGPVP